MRSNSDDSDCDDRSAGNQSDDQGTEEKEAYPTFFPEESSEKGHGKKRKHAATVDESSDLNDSDCNEDYYENFEERVDMQFRSHSMYQDLSYEQDSADESTSQNVQSERVNNKGGKANDDGEESKTRISFEEPRHYSKRRKLDAEGKADEGTADDGTKEQKTVPDGKDKAQRMMRMMGFKEGHGLGKNMQGRVEPVEASKQHGRRGLGHHVPGLEASGLKWNAVEEEIKVEEELEWISSPADLPTAEELADWLELGPKKKSIDDETQFCDQDVVLNVVNSKSVFDKLDNVEVRRARARCNPYETIRGAIFLNRAAVKMANIDKACNFMFTNPEGLDRQDLLYFADVCAGPGGFSEYVLWRKKWHANGFGFTLKNENDFKLDNFYAGSPETFHPYYGPKDNGDAFDPSNQRGFKELIMRHTHGKGVHFMMSDGGFLVDKDKNLQEIFFKQLYLCQCLVALMIVRVKGHFVTKLFDLFTPFSAGLVYLMYRCFEEVCIFKPNSSRPANSERYLICKSKRPGTRHIEEHLDRVNHLLRENDDNNDVVQLVAFKELEREEQFLQYLRESNKNLGRKQVIGLRKIAAFCEDSTLAEPKQADMRKGCCEYWNIPTDTRIKPRQMKPQEKLKTLLNGSATFLNSEPKKLTMDNIGSTILKEPYDWFCIPCGSGPSGEANRNATFYMSMGRTKVYRYGKREWMPVGDINIELPPDTLVYAELVYEIRKEFRLQSKVLALHILDALVLGGEDISQKYVKERHRLIKKFCQALWKPDGGSHARIRAKELFPVGPNLGEKLYVKQHILKNNLPALGYEFSLTPLDRNDSDDDKPYIIPNSILFLKSTACSWNRYFSNTHNVTYVFNSTNRATLFDKQRPAEAEAGFIESFENRVIWYWPNDETLPMERVVELVKEKYTKHEVSLDY